MMLEQLASAMICRRRKHAYAAASVGAQLAVSGSRTRHVPPLGRRPDRLGERWDAAAPEQAARGVLSRRPATATTIALLVAATYGLLVAVLWAPFGTRSGMGYETTLVYASESRSLLDGFFYSDPLRRFTQLFYQAGYQLSNVLGLDGSFLGNQIVYAALWWARGFLVFLILRRLFPHLSLFAYAAGTLVLVHAADGALNWVGQLSQFGVIFWMLLAAYLLVVALQQEHVLRTALFALGAATATYLCLWSYESPLFILLSVPLLLLPMVGLSWRTGTVVAIYYVFPFIFIQMNFERYVGSGGATYQEGLVRDDLTVTNLVEDLAYNVKESAAFWRWGDILPSDAGGGLGALLVGLASATIVVLGGLLVARLGHRQAEPLSRREAASFMCAGTLLLAASFPAYLVLTDARSLWRTQLLAGIGFGIAAAALLALVASSITDRRFSRIAIGAGGAVLAFAGGWAAYKSAAYHFDVWQRHRGAMAQILDIAPHVEPGTVVVLTDVPKDADPFGHNMWFDVALRLAYPRTLVAGIYYYDKGTPSPGSNMLVRDGRWVQLQTGFPTLIAAAPFSNTVVIRYSETNHPKLLTNVPDFVSADEANRGTYAPGTVIVPGTPSPVAQRRYG